MIVTYVKKGTPGYSFGINVNDEIIAIDGLRCDKKFLLNYLKMKKENENVTLLVNRGQNIIKLEIPFRKTVKQIYSIDFYPDQELNSNQRKILKKMVEII